MSGDGAPRLALVVPCFNEERALPITIARLQEELARLVEAGEVARDSTIYLVDDGSVDDFIDDLPLGHGLLGSTGPYHCDRGLLCYRDENRLYM